MQIKFFFIITLFFFALTPNAQIKNNTKPFVVVLDAGHGGKDPGRPTSYGYKEKDIVLDIVLQVGMNLESVEDILVVYTRKSDIFLELRERASIANKVDADLFVSIHCNAHDSQAHGTETFVLGLHRNDSNFRIAQEENEVIFLEENYEKNYEGFNPSSPESFIALTLLQEDYLDQSILLATTIQTNFTEKLNRKNRGVKQAGFWVLHNTYMPSVLIETGFITNKKEGDYLNSKLGKQEISKSISDAIINYKSNLNADTLTQVDETSAPILLENIIFRVQIAASSKRIPLKSYNFNGLGSLTRQKSDRIWRYFHGETNNYSKALKMCDNAIKSGYKDSFIVAYNDGVKISIQEALKTKKN